MSDRTLYVSPEENRDGSTPETAVSRVRTPFQTLSDPETMGTPGRVHAAAGAYDLEPIGPVVQNVQSFHGAGPLATTLHANAVTCGAAVSSVRSRGEVRDLAVVLVQGGCVGVRVGVCPNWAPSTAYDAGALVSRGGRIYKATTTGVSGSEGPTGETTSTDGTCSWSFVQHGTGSSSNQSSRLTNVLVQPDQFTGDGAICFGIGDDTTFDVSETMLVNCQPLGNYRPEIHSIGIKIGAGTGNVLDATIYGGCPQGHEVGVMLSGGTVSAHGVSFVGNRAADIRITQPGIGSTSFVGGRSENSGRFLVDSGGSSIGYMGARVADYTVAALQNVDGQGIQCSGPLVVENVRLLGEHCAQFVRLALHSVDHEFVPPLVVRGLTSEHPYPIGGSPWSRPGKCVHAEDLRFMGDAAMQLRVRSPGPVRWVRRTPVVDDEQEVAIDPRFGWHSNEVRLSADAGPVTLRAGDLGQEIVLCFEQDGVGGRAYAWPSGVAYDGAAAPTIVTAPHARQSMLLRWSGRQWEQSGLVVTTGPTERPFSAHVEDFAGGGLRWLGSAWELLPGGGSLGVRDGEIVCNAIGWIGDNDLDVLPLAGLAAGGAGAVVDVGGDGTAAVEATFTWYENEGVVLHYKDDHTFIIVHFVEPYWRATCFVNGRQVASAHANFLGPAPVEGEASTVRVRCTATALECSVDDGPTTSLTWLTADERAQLFSHTRHGIVLGDRRAACVAFSVLAP